MIQLHRPTLDVESGPAAKKGESFASDNFYPDFHRRLRLSGLWILGADIAALILSFLGGAAFVWARRVWEEDASLSDIYGLVTVEQSCMFWGLGLVALLWLDSRGHYRLRLPYWESVGNVVAVAISGFVASGFVEFVVQTNTSRLWIAFCWLFFAVFAFSCRYAARRTLDALGAWRIPAVIIGEGPTAHSALRALSRDTIVGFSVVDQLPSSVMSTMKRGGAWNQILMMHDAQHVFLALEGGDIERYHAALKSLPRARVPFSVIPPWQGLPSSTLTPHNFMMQDVLMLHDTNRLKLPLSRLIKRMVDIVLASSALLCLSPLFLVLGLVVRLDGGPAIFHQPRVGKGGKLFKFYKFRSMRIDAEEFLKKYLAENAEAAEEWDRFQKLKHDVRITKVGRIIRKTSIDELPQLINVLLGDMSLVGPRPCFVGQEKLYAEDFSFYESVRPGITGPWQVSGRSHLTFKERVALEAWYARNWSLWLDIVIILKTFPVLLRQGAAV